MRSSLRITCSTSAASSGFTLAELLIVIGILGLLTALLLPSLSVAKSRVKRATCANNLKQVATALSMYADEQSNTFPILPVFNPYPDGIRWFYKELIKGYVGLNHASSKGASLFACPSDTFIANLSTVDSPANNSYRINSIESHNDARSDYSSYEFNGFTPESAENAITNLAGVKVSSVKDPSKTILAGEASGYLGFSWHNPHKPIQANGSESVFGFVDGHVDYVKIYWNGQAGGRNLPAAYSPPYQEYKWRAD